MLKRHFVRKALCGLAAFGALAAADVGARMIDSFNDAVVDSTWQKNVVQAGNPNDTIVFDQATTPGKLTITYTDDQGSDQNTHFTRTNAQLTRVGDYLQADVKLEGTPSFHTYVGIGMLWTDVLGSINRSNSCYVALRGDGIIKQNGYGDGGSEIADRDTPIAGYATSDVITLRIERSSATELKMYYGVNGPATLPSGGWTINYAAQSTVPVYPGLYLSNGLQSFVATVDNFRAGNMLDARDDHFNDDAFSLNWDPANYPQFSSLNDSINITESNNVLHLDYVANDGSDQANMLLRDDLSLDDGESVIVLARITSGAANPNVGVGIALATQGNSIYQSRANTVWFVLRNDGLARLNAFGNGGAEIGDFAPSIPGYAMGDWVTLRVERNGNQLDMYYGDGFNVDATELVGSVDYSAHALPTVPGIMLVNGLASFQAEVEYMVFGYGLLPVELAEFTAE